MSEFIRELHKGNKNCNIKVISAEEYREELIQDAFINRLASPLIRQHILENKQLDIQTAFDQANALDLAQKNSEAYMTPVIKAATAMASSQVHERKEVTISTITHSESSLAAKQVLKGDASFVVVLCITGPNAQQEMKTATNVALKVALENCVGRRKTFKFNKFNKGTTAALFPNNGKQLPCSPCPFSRSLLLGQEAYHKHL